MCYLQDLNVTQPWVHTARLWVDRAGGRVRGGVSRLTL